MCETGRRILVADDSAADVYMLEHALAAAALDCAIVHVEDGDQALAALEIAADGSSKFALVLLDWHLPKRPGGEILPHIERIPGAPQCIVLTSGLPNGTLRELAGKGVKVWNKPDDLDGYLELGKSLREVLLSAGSESHQSAAAT